LKDQLDMKQSVGILALQGCIDPHVRHFSSLGANPVFVKSGHDLSRVQRLVIPGGESSTMLNLLRSAPGQQEGDSLFEDLKKFTSLYPVWGICAGAILLAKEVLNPSQESLKAIAIKAERNFYGSQLFSFKAEVNIPCLDGELPLSVDFIRAPSLTADCATVNILANLSDVADLPSQIFTKGKNQQILLRNKNILCSSFHSELGKDNRLHKYFLEM
jgi:5'-phosphate synthase pdxT subunit